MWLRFTLRLVHTQRRWCITLNVIEIHFKFGSHSEKGMHRTKWDWDSLYYWFTLREGDASHWMWLRFALMLVHSHRRWWCITPNVIEIHFKIGSQATEGDTSHRMWLRFALMLVHSHRRWWCITPNVIEIHFKFASQPQKVTHHIECDWDSL